jgi:hypothetical protein
MPVSLPHWPSAITNANECHASGYDLDSLVGEVMTLLRSALRAFLDAEAANNALVTCYVI